MTGDAVWAIDEDHLPNYLLPRDCRRVTYAIGPNTSVDDVARYCDDANAKRFLVLEEKLAAADRPSDTPYLRAARRAVLTRRQFGWLPHLARRSRTSRGPHLAQAIGEIATRGCSVRFFESISPLRDAVTKSSLDYSIIRMRNAARKE
ncbi:MAG: hypothetical protein HY243_11795 [Proteobacteria bacterium]|nr:hypothetical protein [Pseudomonadota bacterium]